MQIAKSQCLSIASHLTRACGLITKYWEGGGGAYYFVVEIRGWVLVTCVCSSVPVTIFPTARNAAVCRGIQNQFIKLNIKYIQLRFSPSHFHENLTEIVF